MARKKQNTDNGANLGFEQKLWLAADKLRGHMDAAKYKHVVLGLVFLKYISDAFEEHRQKLLAMPGADPEDRDAEGSICSKRSNLSGRKDLPRDSPGEDTPDTVSGVNLNIQC